MPINRAELLAKLDKLVAAERESLPPIDSRLVDDEDTLSEELEAETLAPTPPLALSDSVSGAFFQ